MLGGGESGLHHQDRPALRRPAGAAVSLPAHLSAPSRGGGRGLDLYYEPRRPGATGVGGRQAYFAAARVTGIRSDSRLGDHFYADVDAYLEFDRPVPFREGARYYESALHRDDGGTSKGAFGRAVRGVPDAEFDAIMDAGFATLVGDDTARDALGSQLPPGFEDEPATFERPMVERLTVRPFRDAALLCRSSAPTATHAQSRA
jgi:putative restriction endonuclease